MNTVPSKHKTFLERFYNVLIRFHTSPSLWNVFRTFLERSYQVSYVFVLMERLKNVFTTSDLELTFTAKHRSFEDVQKTFFGRHKLNVLEYALQNVYNTFIKRFIQTYFVERFLYVQINIYLQTKINS